MKPIPFHYSLRVAGQVRRAVNRLNTNSELSRQGSMESFDNCREQGYVLSIFAHPKNAHIAFAQQRNSDDIVVYVYTDVDFPTNLPAENAWNDRMFFSFGETENAAKYILKRASEFVK